MGDRWVLLEGGFPTSDLCVCLPCRALLPGGLPQCHLLRGAGVLALCPLPSDLR